MQTAHILLSLGGDNGNTVPKFNVTAAEIAVLRLIHGDESVVDIEPVGELSHGHREERSRLLEKYGREVEGRFVSPAVEALFPGVAARVFVELDELDLPEEFFKAEKRVSSKTKAKAVEPAAPVAPADGKKPRGGKKAAAAPTPTPEPEVEAASEDAATDEDEDNDGIGDMTDGVGEKLFQ